MKKLTQRQINEAAAWLSTNGLGSGARIHGRADDLALTASDLGNDELAERLDELGGTLVEVCDGEVYLLDLGED